MEVPNDDFFVNYAQNIDQMGGHPAKPVINMLTILAEDHIQPPTSERIVQLIDNKIRQVVNVCCLHSG